MSETNTPTFTGALPVVTHCLTQFTSHEIGSLGDSRTARGPAAGALAAAGAGG